MSLLIVLIFGAGITAFVSYRVRRSSSVSTRDATEAGVSFVVSSRSWVSALLGGCGILLIAVGCLLLLVAISDPSQVGAGIPGVVIAPAGVFFVVMARGVRRTRLEVTDDSVWVFRRRGRPRQVPVHEITRLAPMLSNRYGGVVARSDKRRLFTANRLMLGYPRLIDYLRTSRPDLSIPDASSPM